MLTLKTKTFSLPADIPDEICRSFEKPLIFYMAHKDDQRYFFLTFVILDFAKKELRYIVSYLPENIEKIENHSRSEIFRIENPHANPHCTISAKGDAPFLTFIEYTPYFFKVDWQKNVLSVYTDDDFEKLPGEEIVDFSPTVYPDPRDPNHFYFSSSRRHRLIFHRAALNLSKIEDIHIENVFTFASPHVIKKIDRYLVNSDFFICRFKNLKSGRIFGDHLQYTAFIYKSLYEKYCEKNNLTCPEDFFQNKDFVSELQKDSEFSSFYRSCGKNFLEICKRNPEYSFSALPGTIMLFDPETKEKKFHETTFCAPAHFEVDEKSGDIFVSSHNFVNFDRRYYLGPAAIDRFRLENGNLKKISTFIHPRGYRFISHKVFSWEGKNYICTSGQPNRLFFINADTMELEFFEDIGEDFLSEQTDVATFLNYANLEPFAIKSFAVSQNGRYLFLMSYDYLYFYDFSQRKIIHKMKYTEGTSPDGEIDLANFYKKTTHIDYLDFD